MNGEQCLTCVHWGSQDHPDDNADNPRRRCHGPRLVKETIEWRRGSDWCSSYKLKGQRDA